MKYSSWHSVYLFILLSISAQAQQGIDDDVDVNRLKQEQKNFESTFQKELDQLEEPSERDYVDTRPAELPPAMIDQAGASSQYLGISDPCMDKKKAIETARMRALAVMGLCRQVTARYVADYYTNQQQSGSNAYNTSSKWEEYGKLQSTFRFNPAHIAVIDTYITKYNEALVTIDHSEKDASVQMTDTMTIEAGVYHMEQQAGNSMESLWQLAVRMEHGTGGKDNTWTNHYTLKEAGKSLRVVSRYGNQQHQICPQYYQYKIKGQADTVGKKSSHSLAKGLWGGYVSALMRSIIKQANEDAERIKVLGEMYRQNYEDLSRSVTKDAYTLTNISLHIKGSRIAIKSSVNQQ